MSEKMTNVGVTPEDHGVSGAEMLEHWESCKVFHTARDTKGRLRHILNEKFRKSLALCREMDPSLTLFTFIEMPDGSRKHKLSRKVRDMAVKMRREGLI